MSSWLEVAYPYSPSGISPIHPINKQFISSVLLDYSYLQYSDFRTGVLGDDRMKLDYVLGLKIEDFLERRLQTQVIYILRQRSYEPNNANLANRQSQVFKLGLAKSIHHARVLIKQRHIRVRKQVQESFFYSLHPQFHPRSRY